MDFASVIDGPGEAIAYSITTDRDGELLIAGTRDRLNDATGFFLRAQQPRILVSNANDSGPGSLRQAIEDANANAGLDYVEFNIPGAGPHIIRPQSPLDPITDPIFINGTSEPDFTGMPMIEIDGSNLTDTAMGLTIDTSDSEIRGLVINDFDVGIRIASGENNVVAGNYIGTNSDATTADPNRTAGIEVLSANNLIGGTTPADRNVVAGNEQANIQIVGESAHNNRIEGNYIGTNAAGVASLGDTSIGVLVLQAPDNVIGGAGTWAGNVISGNRLGVSETPTKAFSSSKRRETSSGRMVTESVMRRKVT